MQFMKRKSITAVLLIAFVMSWTSTAFAFVSAVPNTHQSINTSIEDCMQQSTVIEHNVMQHDMSAANCEHNIMQHKEYQYSHMPCQDCSISQCQNTIFSFNLADHATFKPVLFNSKTTLNPVYGIFHSSDFKQDILRPPQA